MQSPNLHTHAAASVIVHYDEKKHIGAGPISDVCRFLEQLIISGGAEGFRLPDGSLSTQRETYWSRIRR